MTTYQKISKEDKKAIKKKIASRFTQYETIVEIMINCWNAAAASSKNENIIFFGPAGYGKSEGSEEFAEFLYEKGYISTKPYILSFNQSTTESKIYGGTDIKTLREEGREVYNLDASMFNSEVIIIEEMFDAFPDILLSLKDTLTSGYVRNGDQVMKIKTKMIIALTNKEPESIVENDAFKAVLERFLFQYRVCWADHSKSAYESALNLRKDVKNNEIIKNFITPIYTEIINSANNQLKKKKSAASKLISPRTMQKAFSACVANASDELLEVKIKDIPVEKNILKFDKMNIRFETELNEFFAPLKYMVDFSEVIDLSQVELDVKHSLSVLSTSLKLQNSLENMKKFHEQLRELVLPENITFEGKRAVYYGFYKLGLFLSEYHAQKTQDLESFQNDSRYKNLHDNIEVLLEKTLQLWIGEVRVAFMASDAQIVSIYGIESKNTIDTIISAPGAPDKYKALIKFAQLNTAQQLFNK